MSTYGEMVAARGEENKAVLVGKSVHNQRIKRHNRALNEQVLSIFKTARVFLTLTMTQIFSAFIACIFHLSTEP